MHNVFLLSSPFAVTRFDSESKSVCFCLLWKERLDLEAKLPVGAELRTTLFCSRLHELDDGLLGTSVVPGRTVDRFGPAPGQTLPGIKTPPSSFCSSLCASLRFSFWNGRLEN